MRNLTEAGVVMSSSANCATCANHLLLWSEEIQTTSEVKQANIAGEPETVPVVTADDVKRIPQKKKKVCRQPVRRSLRLSLKRVNDQDKSKHHFRTKLNQGTCGSGDRLVSDALEVASEFNRFFASVAGGRDPRSSLQQGHPMRRQSPATSLALVPVFEEEINQIIQLPKKV
ncbi:hypothetical protein J6590_072651 [Homalodisca vitripennis]|nr:hypothetical protein J6590_072651 [Homalodisca vitripennis]